MTAVLMQQITDKNIILDTVRHPKIYPHISDDSCPKNPNDLEFINEDLIYLGAYLNNIYHGLFLIHKHNFILFEVHTSLLPKAWGNAVLFAKSCIEWVFKNTLCQRLITSVPDENKLALRLAKNSGMIEYGYNPMSIMKNSKLLGQTMLGINKGGELCQH